MPMPVPSFPAPCPRYYGTLKNGVPEGLGSCLWPDGAKYDGEWRAGLMHGFGTYVWKSGQRFDGEWKVRWPVGREQRQGWLCRVPCVWPAAAGSESFAGSNGAEQGAACMHLKHAS